MKLFIVTDRDRWGYSVNVVRALNEEQASRMINPKYPNRRVEVEELKDDTWPGILWTHDESPDSDRS
jgi:hypothetical protein